MLELDNIKIAVIGLGYVGLPLAVEFGKKYPCVGYDINQLRIEELQKGIDCTLEVEPEELVAATQLRYAHELEDLAEANFYIVTVPTPVDAFKRPDLMPLIKASESIGSILKKDDIVVYESTVYPGATEEVCVPILEKISGLKFNQDFYVGYSPERINPGDKEHRVTSILKVTSGSTAESANVIDALYRSIITAGTHKTSSIKIAEAAKVIENTQRDVNIGLVNELAVLFHKLNIDTLEVLEAAGTKWNFLPFRPGLVGGHCIGVDPYYLTHKAQEVGHHPDIILAGRRINDSMGSYIAGRLIQSMARKCIPVADANVLILGLTFKENCPDLRNTKVINIVSAMQSYHTNVDVYDPWVSSEDAQKEYGITTISTLEDDKYHAVVLAVAHDEFKEMGITGIRKLCKENAVLFDIKALLPKDQVDERL